MFPFDQLGLRLPPLQKHVSAVEVRAKNCRAYPFRGEWGERLGDEYRH